MRAFAAKAEWAPGHDHLSRHPSISAIVSNSSTMFDDIAGGRAVGIRAPFGGWQKLTPGTSAPITTAKSPHRLYLIALCPYHSIAVDTA
jgi:hypothetical protein